MPTQVPAAAAPSAVGGGGTSGAIAPRGRLSLSDRCAQRVCGHLCLCVHVLDGEAARRAARRCVPCAPRCSPHLPPLCAPTHGRDDLKDYTNTLDEFPTPLDRVVSDRTTTEEGRGGGRALPLPRAAHPTFFLSTGTLFFCFSGADV